MKKKLLIFLIDDSASSNLYHKVMMEDAGINVDEQVREFTSSKEAKIILTDIYKNKNVDQYPSIILLDINMPQINGWELVNILENLNISEEPCPKIFMVSNSRHPNDLEKAKKYNIIEDILEKHLEVGFFRTLKKDFEN